MTKLNEKCTHHGRNIEYWRVILKLSQVELGERMNLSQSQISKYENMEEIETDILTQFSKALKIPVSLLKECDHKSTIDDILTYINYVFEGGTLNQNKITNQINNPLDTVLEFHKQIVDLTRENAELKTELKFIKENKK